MTQKEICKYLELEEATFSRWKTSRPKLYRCIKNYFLIVKNMQICDIKALKQLDDEAKEILKNG